MPTLRTNILELIARVDPAAVDGTAIVDGNLNATDPESFTKTDLIAKYNEARIVLWNALRQVVPPILLAEVISGLVGKDTGLQFSGGVMNKPTGFLKAILLTDVSNNKIAVLPASTIDITKHLDSADNPIVYEEDTAFRSENGNSYIPDLSTYKLRYYKLVAWTVANFTTDNPTKDETFNLDLQPILLQIAESICNEVGGAEVNALAKRLVERYKEGLV